MSCRKMVKVKKKIYAQWNILQSSASGSREDRRGCPYVRDTSTALQPVDELSPEPGPVPTRERKLQEVQAWIEIRSSLHAPAVESLCPPPNPCCHLCNFVLPESAIWRCGDCDSQATLCSSCVIKVHSNFNTLHEIELWDVSIFSPFPLCYK